MNCKNNAHAHSTLKIDIMPQNGLKMFMSLYVFLVRFSAFFSSYLFYFSLALTCSIFFTPLLTHSFVFIPSFAFSLGAYFIGSWFLLWVLLFCDSFPPLPFVCVSHLINIVGWLCSFRLLLAVIVVRFFVFFSCRSFHIPAIFSLALTSFLYKIIVWDCLRIHILNA